MSKRGKVRLKNVFALLGFAIVFIITLPISANCQSRNKIKKTPAQASDTTTKKKQQRLSDTTKLKQNSSNVTADTLSKKTAPVTIDTTNRITDTLVLDTSKLTTVTDTLRFNASRDSLDAPVIYSAEDSGVLNIPGKQFILYGKANAKYTDLDISAATIELDQSKQMMYAYGSLDTTGNPMSKPKLIQGETTSVSDSIRFNLRSRKGLTKSSYLQEGEIYVFANTVKKVSDNVLYAWRGRFTTCNLDTPHFAFRTRKMKIINKKMAVTGPAFPEFEGVPIPIGIPFGIFPLNRDHRHSGFLAPTFEANEDFGLGLVNGGYYKVISSNLDVTLRSKIYSYGGYTINASSRYLKRYRYTGGFNLSYQNTKLLNRAGNTKEEFTTNKSYMVNWSHSRDSRARPGTSFSASVNAGSTQYNKYVSNNPQVNFNNNLSSSINYTKDWRGKYNLSVSANHSQNSVNRLVNLNLPTVNFSAVTIYPFQRKEQIGAGKWYEKLGIAYTGNINNQVSFYDSAFNLRRVLDTAQWGATHTSVGYSSETKIGPSPQQYIPSKAPGIKFIRI